MICVASSSCTPSAVAGSFLPHFFIFFHIIIVDLLNVGAKQRESVTGFGVNWKRIPLAVVVSFLLALVYYTTGWPENNNNSH